MIPCLLLALVAAYAVFLWQHAVVVPAGSDSSGYFNAARALLAGRVHEAPRELPGLPMATLPSYAYTPLGFVPEPGVGRITPSYPPGLPALFAGSSALLGWQLGPLLVLVLHGIGGVVLTYALARTSGVSLPVSALCAMAIAVSPLQLMFSLQAMSDVPALFWCTLALLAALNGGRRAALGAGFAIGMAVLIRPTSALILVPVLIAFGGDWRRWLWCGLGGLPAAIYQGWYNREAYGAIISTGYGDLSIAFGREWVIPGLTNYAWWLPVLLSPLVLLAPAAAAARREKRRAVIVHATWVGILAGFYSAYYHTQETWWYLRFILPAFPSLAVLAALGAERLLEPGRPRVRQAAWAVALALIAFNGWHWSRQLGAHQAGIREQIYPDAIELIRREVPADGVVLTLQMSGVVYFSTGYTIVRWDQLDDNWPRVRAAAAQANRPVYAALFAFEREMGFAQRIPGNWEKVSELGVFTLWRLLPDQP